MKIEESLNVTFDKTPPPSKTSPLVDDDLDEDQAVKVAKKKVLDNDIEDETLEVDEIVSIKESKNHPLENVIGNLTKEPLAESTHKQKDDELTDKKVKKMKANDQAIQTILIVWAEGNENGNNGIQLQAEEFDPIAAAGDIDEKEEVNAN
nr:hypothetical protein CTI12_AA182560 [Tanacetum cinerariifolium]